MCGIAGFWRRGWSAEEIERVVVGMTATLRHRGPDGGGSWCDEAVGVALGHRRLSIIDLSPSGHQPMVSASGRYVITYNGEVYNFGEIRQDLESRGAAFRGASDTEVILTAIEEFGIKRALQKFIGMFAFALWDRKLQELVLVRDRLGIKPLYWAQFGNLFVFGSELKSLRACPGWAAEVDPDSVAAFLRWNHIPSPTTIYRGVEKLAPGQILRIGNRGKVEIETYWDPVEMARRGLKERETSSIPECLDELSERLNQSIAHRMISDVPLGAFLSGGIDSSVVAAIMQSRAGRPVQTFTIGFGEYGYDEAPYAKAVAAHLGTDHTELYVEPSDALKLIPDLPAIYDEPFADSSQIPTYFISRMTRQHVTVALSGDGGDELFAGYTRYHWANWVWKYFSHIPFPIRRRLGAALSSSPPEFWNAVSHAIPQGVRPQRAGERAIKLGKFMEQPDADSIFRSQHSQWDFPEDLVNGCTEPVTLHDRKDLAVLVPNFVERMQLIDLATYLPDDILTKVDRASMSSGLEVRVPMLDHRVVEYAWRIRPDLKYRNRTSKWLLRQLLYRHVPEALVTRSKSGFAAPIGSWLQGPLRDWAETLLEERQLRQLDIFAVGPVRRSWEQLLSGRNWLESKVWCVLMFLAWHDQHMSATDIGDAMRTSPEIFCHRASPWQG